jgi:hypothetical protein
MQQKALSLMQSQRKFSTEKACQKHLKFREDFSIFIMLIFIGLGIAIFLLSRRSK